MGYQEKPPIDYLMHVGKGHLDGGHSGRYPWGSGEHRYQRSDDFLSRVKKLKEEGLTEVEIAAAMGFVNENGQTQTGKLRIQMDLAKQERREASRLRAQELLDSGNSPAEVTRMMGFKNESSLRSLLDEKTAEHKNEAKNVSNVLKNIIDEQNSDTYFIDIGPGVERELGISREKLDRAAYILEMQGYQKYSGRYQQPTNPDKGITLTVLGAPGSKHKDMFTPENIHYIRDYSANGDTEKIYKFEYPKSMDSKRLQIRYAEDVGPDGISGLQKDGVIELRRGVEDISLGESRYAQVRMLVDGTHYLKGMAVYSDNMPDGVDVIFNTNKRKGTPVFGSKDNTVLKPIKSDPDDPFGSYISAKGQRHYTDANGETQLSVINKRADESDWSDWSNAIPSQFLSKQSMKLINQQLDLAKSEKQEEYEKILALNNPTVKKVRLQKFAEDCDATAVELKAAALPGQHYHVILPINSVAEDEVYAPRYKDGEKLALIRYPHGGTFEIPILKVNKSDKVAKKIIGNSEDAVGINKKVADQLSGADFDGDTVMVIPTNNKVKITNRDLLPGLVGFEPKEAYAYRDGIKTMQKSNVQREMGTISNLITDMTLKGATDDELAAAVRHSMVVVDAEKHRLDYKRSEKENNIAKLKDLYQLQVDPETGKTHHGASTLISKAKSEERVLKRQGNARINQKGKPWYDENKPEGALIYKEVKETYVKDGKTFIRTQKSTKMAETSDARTLSSGTLQEEAYANYANFMKKLANSARKEMVYTGRLKYSASANKTYKKEVDSLKAKLENSELNRPKERKATVLATSKIRAQVAANPELKTPAYKKELKKLRQKAMTDARAVVGARRQEIKMTDREWEAIQAGAISESVLYKIINHMDSKELMERSTPYTNKKVDMSPARINRMKAMSNSGYTLAQIADTMGVSTSTVSKYLKSREEG